MSTALAIVPVVLLAVAFVGFCAVELVRRESLLLPRWAWLLVCLASVPLGGIVYLLVGRGELRRSGSDGPVTPPASPAVTVRSVAPTGADNGRGPSDGVAVRVDALVKRYGDHAALDGISLEVPTGSAFGVVGPNGAGKTTLLGILAGLRHPTAGDVHLAAGPGRVALLPDTPHFEPWLTAREVVDLARTLMAPDRGAERTVEVLAQVGLSHAADRATGGFSRGMLQRLGLAATIVGQPDLLLLDEPCSALDPLGRREVLDLIARLGETHTVLFCSHILDDVQEVCDRVGILRDGRVLFQGTVQDLLVGAAAPEYTVRLRAPVEPAVEALGRQPWVRSVERVGAEELHVRAGSVDDAEQHLAGTLAAAGARVVSIMPAGADLERVFLTLTAGDGIA